MHCIKYDPHKEHSGPVRSNARIKEYHYNIYPGIKGGAEAKAVDPKVIIKP